MPIRSTRPPFAPPAAAIVAAAVMAAPILAAAPASAGDRFKVTSVDCERFSLWKHTPVVRYDIVPERQADYDATPDAGYFREAAERAAAYCDRVSSKLQQPLGPPRRIRGVWFQSNDGRFRALFDLDVGGVDASAGVVNQIGDRHQAHVEADARHAVQVEEIRTRDARERELQAARERAARDKAATDLAAERERNAAANARVAAFMARPDLQRARLGATVAEANFTNLDNVRTNPFHFQKLGLAVVRTSFNRMLTDKLALFGNELQPLFVHLDDVDRFTRSGETVMLAMRVVARGDAERSYGSVPEVILSLMKAEPIWGDYVGAYGCPGDDCGHLFDVAPPA